MNKKQTEGACSGRGRRGRYLAGANRQELRALDRIARAQLLDKGYKKALQLTRDHNGSTVGLYCGECSLGSPSSEAVSGPH